MKFNFNIEDIKYLKILYRDSDSQPATIKAAIKKIDEHKISACVKYEEDFFVNTPQDVTLSIICADGLYRTTTKLLTYSLEEPYLFLYLESPAGLEYQQNREYFRIQAGYACSYYVHNSDETQTFNTKTFDISANGVSILLPVLAISEEESEINMMINEKIVQAKIRYIRSEKVAEGYKVSFTYSDISNADRDYISSTCIKKQLEHKRNVGT